jgi:formylglycine-generating enzyme required for sulfatase activity
MAQKSIEVFFSYSKADKPLRDKLGIHLSSLERQKVITSWHDRQITAGEEWKQEIDHRIQMADIILLLISPDFIASKYCYEVELYEVELPAAMARHEAGEACVVPILMRPVADWESLPFAKLQLYPTGGRPITRWRDEDEAFVDVVKGIKKAVSQLLEKRSFTLNLPDRISLEMIAIPGGKFWMGSPDGMGYDDEQPRHEVTIAPFFMGKYPVTQAQYEAVIGKNPSGFKGENRPVERVSWHDAIAFCQELSKRSDRQFGLPSEAQWEYACRAGTKTKFCFSETISPEQASHNSSNGTSEVGKFSSNQFGLCDMHGNVWEWCADYWHESYEGAPENGSAWITASKDARRLLRGGSWSNPPDQCRSAYRLHYSPDGRIHYIGFRVVCV